MSAKIFVGNLSFQTTPDQLRQFLAEAGQIVDVYLPTDRETGRPRGFAFVQYASESEAASAIRLFNDRELGGRRLKVNQAEDRPPGGGGPRPPRLSGPPPGSMSFESDLGPPRGAGARPFRAKGSRRGLRRRKRSL